MHGDEPGIDSARTPPGGWRGRLRENPATRHTYKVGVFIAGLLCIALGAALVVLPGPLTIPPMLLGLWIWSWEFRFAEKIFDEFREKGEAAWEEAKRRPVLATVTSVGGIVLAGVVIWAMLKYDLIEKGKDAIGL